MKAIEVIKVMVLKGIITAEQADRALSISPEDHDIDLRSRAPEEYTEEEIAHILEIPVILEDIDE